MAGFEIFGTTDADFYRGSATGIPRKKSSMFPRSIFVSLPLILTFLPANICHFLIATLNFFYVFFFRNELRLLSFFFWFCFVSFALALSHFSVIGVSVTVVGENSRTHDHVIMKFSRTYRLPFFFRTRESFANTHSLLRKVVNY